MTEKVDKCDGSCKPKPVTKRRSTGAQSKKPLSKAAMKQIAKDWEHVT